MRMKLLALSVLLMTSPVHAEICSDVLREASRLVLVTTPSMNVSAATLQLFVRRSSRSSWSAVGPAERAVVGRAGLAWGYTFVRLKIENEVEKFEGDGRTPAGFFRMGPPFGLESSELPGYIKIRPGETVCVEDSRSVFYNRIVKRSEVEPGINPDDMGGTPLYRKGLFVAYPSDRATRRGSCIFVHIWERSGKGTNGCIGLPESRVAALQEFARGGAIIAVLSEAALERFPECLPGHR